jgi:biofilm PGA synthesis N-glycosyltransferase PgaC
MEIYFSILSLVYTGLLLSLFISWKRIRFYAPVSHAPATFISVIVPVRNEEKNIRNLLNDLNAQTYPSSLFEVIIMDDHSTDGSAEIVRSYIPSASFNLTLQTPGLSGNLSFKKKAIEEGITIAKGTLIMTTDGDCRVGPEWISTVENFYQNKKAKFISSPVLFNEGSIFKNLQNIEFASLIGTGAASLNMGTPNMCNGANIAYEREVFLEVNGFQGNENIPSGDDEFLMHKIFRRYPGKVSFLKSQSALVYTDAKESLAELFEQRKRWASKWGSYTFLHIKALAIFVFIYNVSLLLGIILASTGNYSPLLLLIQLIPKIILEALFLSSVLKLSGKPLNPILFLCLQITYPLYVITVSVISRIGGYSWKGRSIGR